MAVPAGVPAAAPAYGVPVARAVAVPVSQASPYPEASPYPQVGRVTSQA